MEASSAERRAFLIGAANMIALDLAYAQKRDVEPSPVSNMIVEAVQDLKFADMEARMPRWYETHPGETAMPVMGVIWNDIVKKSEPK